MVCEQRLPERGRVRRQERADLERLVAVVGAEDVVDDEHLVLVQRPDADTLLAAGGEGVGPVEARVRSSLPSR